MNASAVQSYIDKWLAVQPQQRVALAFVDPRRYPGHVALAAWQQELLTAAYGISEPQIAEVKLNWWLEELNHARQQGGKHPLTQALFADPRAGQIALESWLAPVLAALAQLEQGSAADFSAQLAAAEPLHGALARLETAWWFGPAAATARAVRMASLSHLLQALLRLEEHAERDPLPLPMSRLAYYGLSRTQLRTKSAAREQAIKAQLTDLVAAWRVVPQLAGPLSVFRSVDAWRDQYLAAWALRQPLSLEALRRNQSRIGPRAAWFAWRAARAWQRWPQDSHADARF